MRYFISLLFLISALSCEKADKTTIDVSNINVKLDVQRFEQRFYTSSPEKLMDLKSQFPYLFPLGNPDSVWVNKMKNKDELNLFAESQKLYKDFTNEKVQLIELFKHIKYYYPKFKEPKVITILSNVDYNNNVVLADSLMFVSLDIFLGKDNKIYQDFPNYIKQNYTKEHMIVAIAEKYAEKSIPPSLDKSFLSGMIQEGKKLALTQAFLPKLNANEIIGYTKEQFDWAENSEIEIWKYFIQNLMLYSTDHELTTRFIEEAPFSKFFLDIDKESPGKIGAWFGWKIVESYLNHNKISIQQAMLIDNEQIFKRSKYKPKKK